MKRYIIMTGAITGMGGAQMYINNKVRFMRKIGWKVYVFSGLQGPILIDGLKEFETTLLPDLDESPQFTSKKKRQYILDKIIALMDNDINGSECLIESSTAHMSFWAELLADKLHCKHYAFLLDEEFNIDQEQRKFFKYKFKRRELAVIKEKSLELLFGKDFDIPNRENFLLVAPCNNVVEDVSDQRFENIDFKRFDYVFCSLGRLNKKYIPSVIEGFKKYAQDNKREKFLYIFIGDQPSEHSVNMNEIIKQTFKELSNVTLLMPGYVFPIPRDILRYIDLAVASAGSSRVLANENIPTITMDATDWQPIGVLGYDTQQTLYRDSPIDFNLETLINKVVHEKYLDNFTYHLEVDINCDIDEYMKKHLEFVVQSDKKLMFFDVNHIKNKGLKNHFKRILIGYFGVESYRKITKKIRNKGK